MRKPIQFLFAFLLTSLLAVPAVHAAPAQAEDLKSVLARLDVAAKKFHTTSASFVFDSMMTDPIPDKDTQSGVVYYQRSGSAFKMAAHIREKNGRPAPGAYNFIGGVLRFFDGSQQHIYQAAKWESYLMLGFGASGSELAEKWDIKYLGSQTMNGVNVAQLELAAKDPEVRKTISKVTLWIDPDRGVSLQQRFDEGSSLYRICKYTDIKVNEPLPKNAFDLK